MPHKLVTIFLFAFLAITPAYAASPEQSKSVPKDQNSLQTLIDNANKGDVNAQFNLGRCYYRGEGVSQDYKVAFKWFAKAAEQGHARAQTGLGIMYINGYGVPQDYNEAIKWSTKAAEQGDPNAQLILGGVSFEGKGVPQDYKEAFKWFTKAAEQDNTQAQLTLGSMYINGYGVPQDYNEAAKWITKAAEQGHVGAQHVLGLMFRDGQGVEQNDNEATKWLSKAAEQGDADAQRELFVLFKEGRDVKQNYKENAKWFTKASGKVYKEYDVISVGYISYAVSGCEWGRMLIHPTQDGDVIESAGVGDFLEMILTVRNDDKKPRSIPPFKLLDENGAEYETSDMDSSNIDILRNINPNVTKTVNIHFEATASHKYKLKVSGGYDSDDYALIELSPKDVKSR